MNKTILRGWNWCKRFRKRCGYGVHSPSDFFFITFVIYEKLPFYAYSSLHHLRRLVAHLPGHREKVDKLFFRLVNYVRPMTVIEIGTGSGMTTRYMHEANPDMDIYTISDEKNTQVERIFASKNNIHYLEGGLKEILNLLNAINDGNPKFFHVAHIPFYEEAYEEIIDYATDKDCMIVSYPYADKNKRKWWKSVVDDERTGVTFDLYDIGIVFFDKKRTKENRVVNFL